jgi:hypothetical protein
MFQRIHLFLSSSQMEEGTWANLSYFIVQWLELTPSKWSNTVGGSHLKTETDPISEALCSLKQGYHAMEKVQKYP